MKKQISEIIKQYVDEFSFVSVNKYISELQTIKQVDTPLDVSFLDAYKTIITLAIPYPSKPVKWKGKGYGLLSRYSYNTDYHIVYREILKKITDAFDLLGIQSVGTVDISKVDERFASYLSGLGFLGKNQFLINKNYGTFHYLATILIDKDVQTSILEYDTCGECHLCIDACPSGALDNGFDRDLCLSHLTQAKIPFTTTEIGYLKTMIYGCDICQNVCPKNTGVDIHKYDAFKASGIENVDLGKLLEMSNKEFLKVYGDNASSWKGATIIKRNALCLIANQKLVGLREKIVQSKADFKDVLWYNKTASEVLKILDRE